ncbi:MAG: DUF2950 domain-containing protein [Desulfurivibrionaceae bacterium]
MISQKGNQAKIPPPELHELPKNNRCNHGGLRLRHAKIRMPMQENTKPSSPALSCLILAAIMLLVGCTSATLVTEARQKSFSAPAEAVEALVAAIKTDNLEEMTAVLGPGSEELLSSGDEVADRNGREKFLQAYEQGHTLQQESPDRVVLVLGSRNWPLPIPLVKKGDAWLFDPLAGQQEILDRRIGRNELRVIEVLHAYVEAQHEYATRDCRGGGRVEFAKKLTSSPGQRDGLYWPAEKDEEESPFGPLIAGATSQGYPETDLAPFHGYFFKILKGQGNNAAGGAYDYMVKDRMLLGFALIAYPAEYGNSGIMTFIVNQEGIIYQKDLGEETKQLAEKIELFDPDSTWQRTEETTDTAP